MDVYFDKENLISYINKVMDINDQEVREVDNLLKKQCNLLFSFSKEELIDYCSREQIERLDNRFEIEKREKVSSWIVLNNLHGAKGHTTEYEKEFPLEAPDFCSDEKSAFTLEDEHYRWYTSVVFQSKKKYEKNNIRQLGLLSSITTFEVKTLQKLFINGRNIPSKIYYIRDEEGRSSMKDGYYDLPCTDIIISDPYVFSNKKERPYNKNIYALIEFICKRSNKVNIVFYTEYFQDPDHKNPPEFEDIKDYLKKEYNAKVTFIKPHIKELQKINPSIKDEQHDRYIITNYRMITSGNSFTYYDENGDFVSTGIWASVSSLYDRDNYLIFLNVIRDIQRVIDNCGTDDRSITDTKKSIYGDMESNFLNFNNL